MSGAVDGVLGDRRVAERSPALPGTALRLAANVVAAASVLAGKALIRLGLRHAPEGWRRTVGVLLRSEATRFALSAFGLRVPKSAGDTSETDSFQSRTAIALLSFLAREPDAHFALEWRERVTIRQRNPFVDVVVLRFADDERLEGITPHLSPSGPAAPAANVQARAHQAIIAAYNAAARFPEVERPRRILQEVRTALARKDSAAAAHAQRLLGACCLSFERIDSSNIVQRFCPPPFAARRTLGFGYLSCVAREAVQPGSVDLWISAHHVGLDGVPLQDLIDRLERAWGTAERVTFPPPGSGRPFVGPHPCHAPGERPIDQLVTFVDFSPVFQLREALNAQYANASGGQVTFGTLIAWLLSQEPEFIGVRIASTVDIAASSGYERDVDVVSLRPADFAKGEAPWGGFSDFAGEFNRLVAAARARTGPVREGMQTAGLIPAWAHSTLVRSNPAALDDTFGTLCVTIIREARVFVAPMTDLGLGHGFFAIGSANLPTAAGTRVTAVSVKGDAGSIAHYPEILQRVIERAAALRAAL